MAIEAAIYSLLSGQAPIAAKVGDRISPLRVTQRTDFPRITYERIDTPRFHSLDGPVGLVRPRFQLDCWALTYKEAKDLAALVRLTLDGFKGSVAGEKINGVFIQSEEDLYEPPEHKDDVGVHRCMQDYVFWHDEEK